MADNTKELIAARDRSVVIISWKAQTVGIHLEVSRPKDVVPAPPGICIGCDA